MTVRSLFVGLTGLTAMGQGIDVISNNIANVNTVGFRAGRTSFDDIYYQTLFAGVGAQGARGGINPRQLGTGVKVGSVDTIFTQGSTQSTGRLLDLSVQGDGFFVLRNESGQEFLSRAGNFSLDEDGFIVDPGNGYRLIGQVADENGQLLDTVAPQELNIDFSRHSLARQTENVTARGNFDARVGDPNSDVTVQQALSSSSLLGLFNEGGLPIGLVNGDVIHFETGFLEVGDPPSNISGPLDLTQRDGGRGNGIILTVTNTTTVADLQHALNDYFSNLMGEIRPGAESGIEATYNDRTGSFDFTNIGQNALAGIRVGITPRGGMTSAPAIPNRLLGNIFVNEGNPDFTRTLNVAAESVTHTNSVRRADTTTSIDIFDSQGNSHTVTLGLGADTQAPAATETTTITNLRDSEGRRLIPSDVIPATPIYSDPVVDTGTNTAVFTARQISNIVATQGIYTFQDGSGNMIGLRLSDGALSFNGGVFNTPISATGDVNQEFVTAGVDVTGDSMLNLASNSNNGGGLLGDSGFAAATTLEDIRMQLQNRINAAIRQVAANIDQINSNTTNLQGVPTNGFTPPTDFPSSPVEIQLTDEGSFRFNITHGSLGDADTTDATIAANLTTNAGGEENLGLVFDLAATTRSVRVSLIDPGASIADRTDDFVDGTVDNDFTDGGGITGFIPSVDPFATDVTQAFQIGNTDFGLFDTTGDPTIALANGGPTGIDDSGIHLIALSAGTFGNSDALTGQRFDGFEAFAPEVTAFRALFNQRGYGIAQNFDGRPGIDRTTDVPVGVVARASDTVPFESNTIHKIGITRNTVNYQTVLPSDQRTPPNHTTGTLLFDSNGRFQSYDGAIDPPTIVFDPDNSDPVNGGVNQISFRLDMSGITHFFAPNSAQLETQDGRPVGNLDNVSIAPTGEIVGIFTNGDSQNLGKILLGTVRNEGGLIQNGATQFTVGPNSGERIFVEAGLQGGTINSGSLELSNVDLAQEFTNLIVVQRAYQANSRVITTGDQILTEVISLKR